MARVRFAAEVADIDGNVAVASFSTNEADTVTIASLRSASADFVTALAAATNGKIVQQTVSILMDRAQILPGVTPPTDAEYPSVTDGARLNFSNASGGTIHVTIPAPLGTVFLGPPQRDIVDPAGPAAALITFIKASAGDEGGHPENLYQGGTKVGRGARKRRPPKAGL